MDRTPRAWSSCTPDVRYLWKAEAFICAADVVGIVGAAHVVDGLSIPNDRVRFLKTDVDDAPCKHNPSNY